MDLKKFRSSILIKMNVRILYPLCTCITCNKNKIVYSLRVYNRDCNTFRHYGISVGDFAHYNIIE